jgi:hypothetical protein
MSFSIGVLEIGKKRIKCSGGGRTLIFLIRASSVKDVLSILEYQFSWVLRALSVISILTYMLHNWVKKNRLFGAVVLGNVFKSLPLDRQV